MRYLCVFNPLAGNKNSIQSKNELEKNFKKYNIKVDWFISEYPHHAQELHKIKNLSYYKGIISIGGDGTLFDIINAQMQLPKEKRIPLGIIPAGTGNSVYMDLIGHEQNPEKAFQKILNGNIKKMDVMKATNSINSFHFINIMGFGFTTEVTQKAIKFKALGKYAYSLAIILKLLSLKPYTLTMKNGEKEKQMNNVFVSILNTRYAGGNLLMAPRAKIDDGLMDVIIVNDISRFKLMKTFPKIYDGTYVNSPYVEYFQTKKIKFSAYDSKLLSPDGELSGALPIEVEVIPNALSVFG